MKNLYLLALLTLVTFNLFAQAKAPIDTFVTKSGAVYKGELIEDHSPEYFKFRTLENSELTVPYGSVVNHFFYVPPVVVKQEKKEKPTTNINERYLTNRNTGIVLTSLGIGVLGGGIALIATNPSDAHTYSNSNGAGVNFTGKGAVGLVMALISPAFIITGSVIWSKANHKIRMQRIRNQTPKDL